jgi:predicted transcriptional regulator
MAAARQVAEVSEREVNAVQNWRLRKGEAMSDEENGNELLGLTEKIVSAHVGNNAMSSSDLPNLIKAVYAALENVSTTEAPTPKPKPLVPIKKSVTPNYIVCLEDGKKFKMLKRHLKADHNMTPKEYRERWGLASDYPIVAPAYAKQRSALAKKIGLGTKRRKVKAKGKGAAKK